MTELETDIVLSAMKGKRITITLTPQVNDLIDQMHRMGLFGLTRSAVAERLISEGVIKRLESGIITTRPSAKTKDRGK